MHLLTCLVYFFPARILPPLDTIREDSQLFVKCNLIGLEKQKEVYMYLCKNGIGILRNRKRSEENESLFMINKVTQEDRGEFSCVYSTHELEPATVRAIGHNAVNISVIANVVAADLSLLGPPSVSRGAQVTFQCSLPNVLQTMGDCGSVPSYLMKDGGVLQVQGFDLRLSSATFVIPDVLQRHSGRYSCVVRPSQCFEKDEEQVTGNNDIDLQVKGFPLALYVSLTAVLVKLVLGICAFAIVKKVQQKKSDTDDAQDCTIENNGSNLSPDHSWDNEDCSDYENAADPYSDPAEFDPVCDAVLPSEGE